jgi:hypothetical protein
MTGPVRQVLLAAALTVAAAGCDEKLSDIAGPTPDLAPTLSSIQREIFNTTDASGRVACIQCHSDNGRVTAGNLVLLEGRSYQQLVGRASSFKPGAVLVMANDPDGSYLIHKVEGRSDIIGQRMPRTGGPFLTEGQIRIIRRWIELGAQND